MRFLSRPRLCIRLLLLVRSFQQMRSLEWLASVGGRHEDFGSPRAIDLYLSIYLLAVVYSIYRVIHQPDMAGAHKFAATRPKGSAGRPADQNAVRASFRRSSRQHTVPLP